MFGSFREGDRIVWWTDDHGYGIEPDQPGARRRSGTIIAVHRSPADPERVVAYGVEFTNTFGTHDTTVRPDYGHRPVLAEPGE
ncbi:hypothetical protein [Nocardia wallacei]|uniref:hypothetical protein n=1 Tax=Nocardia wallacei TaxID=480035 RepID=UPI002457098E|nr:hypothetical protein [Nocardia wallacei]